MKQNENQKRERNVWICIKFNEQETCKHLIETLFKKKKLFHMTREYYFYHCQFILKASSPASDMLAWQKNIKQFEQKIKTLDSEISACELKLREQLWIADLTLKTIITDKELHRKVSPATVAMRKDLVHLQQAVSDLKLNPEITNPYADFEYPTYETKTDSDSIEENEYIFNAIQEEITAEKIRDAEIDRKIKTQYNTIVDASRRVMAHNRYIYTQSLYTGIVNVVALITGIGLIAGFFNKAAGGHFFLWEKTPVVDAHPKEWDVVRKSENLLGVIRNN